MSSVFMRAFPVLARLAAWVIAGTPAIVVLVLVAGSASGPLPAAWGLQTLLPLATASILLALAAAAVSSVLAFSVGVLFNELSGLDAGRWLRLALAFLGALPAVVVGWVAAAALVSPAPASSAAFVFAIFALLVLVALPDSAARMRRAAGEISAAVREPAAAAGASTQQTLLWVALPAMRPRLTAAAAWAFCRLVSEATGLQIVFAAFRAPGVAHGGWATLGSMLLAQSRAAAAAGMPQALAPAALLLMLVTGLAAILARCMDRRAASA